MVNPRLTRSEAKASLRCSELKQSIKNTTFIFSFYCSCLQLWKRASFYAFHYQPPSTSFCFLLFTWGAFPDILIILNAVAIGMECVKASCFSSGRDIEAELKGEMDNTAAAVASNVSIVGRHKPCEPVIYYLFVQKKWHICSKKEKRKFCNNLLIP